MKFNLINNTVTWLTISMFIPMAILSFSGLVLCVGENNHMQVEMTCDSCYDFGASGSGASELKGDSNQHPDCGDCNDTDMDQVSSMRFLSRSGDVANMAALANLVCSEAAIHAAFSLHKQVTEYLRTFAQPQLSVSTTILIC